MLKETLISKRKQVPYYVKAKADVSTRPVDIYLYLLNPRIRAMYPQPLLPLQQQQKWGLCHYFSEIYFDIV